MTPLEVEQIIGQGENAQVEFKEALNGLPQSFYETAVSFSNTDGGIVLLGVDDSGCVIGIDRDLCTKLQKDIVSTLNSDDCVSPSIYVQPFCVNLQEGSVLVCQIPASSQIHRYKNDIYVREYESDIKITENQPRIGDLYLRKRNFFSESTIYPFLEMSDLDENLFEKARTLIRGYRSDHPWLFVGNEELLRSSSLYVKDFKTGKQGLTLAAALIFGKDTTIQSILPAYKVEAMVRIKNKLRWDDRIMPPLRTNLIDTYLELKSFINKHLPEKFYLDGDQRVDLRDKIFREVIANAIVHREYTSAYATEMVIYDSEVIITNPCKPLFHGFIDYNNFNPYPKNPNLRKFFTAFGWTEEIGSGVRNANRYVPLYSDGAHPSFEENDIFKVSVPLQHYTFRPYIEDFSEWLNLPVNPLVHLYKGMSNFELPSRLNEISWNDLILDLVPSWVEKGTEFPELLFSEIQYLPAEKIKKVPSWDKKGNELLPKKIWYIVAILSLCSAPISFGQLLHFFQYKKQSSFRENYLNPLKKLQFIRMTKPDTPNAPDNKYVITDLGIAFLLNK